MIVEKARNLLGVGLYTPSEAALYARIPTQLMNRWVFGGSKGKPVLPSRELEEERTVSFLDFVQAMAIRAIRLQHKIPLEKIRKALKIAEREFKLPHLFARQHVTFLFHGAIVVKLSEHEFVEASGAGNRLMERIIELYLQDLTFDANGLAATYTAFKWKEHDIVMNPKLRFGEPVVTSCGYSAKALWDGFLAEGSVGATAKAYDVQPAEVEAACRYFDILSKPAA
jgi:uncharacterized protein (DUF433 family)